MLLHLINCRSALMLYYVWQSELPCLQEGVVCKSCRVHQAGQLCVPVCWGAANICRSCDSAGNI